MRMGKARLERMQFNPHGGSVKTMTPEQKDMKRKYGVWYEGGVLVGGVVPFAVTPYKHRGMNMCDPDQVDMMDEQELRAEFRLLIIRIEELEKKLALLAEKKNDSSGSGGLRRVPGG